MGVRPRDQQRLVHAVLRSGNQHHFLRHRRKHRAAAADEGSCGALHAGFVRDLRRQTTTRVSVATDGTDIYVVEFEKAKPEWHISPLIDGKVILLYLLL